MSEFTAFERNVTSQWGEDGVIEELFKRIGTESKLCVEFGAWDGKHLSNTWKLWHEEEWSALLIEQDKKIYEDLKESVKEFPAVIPEHRFVRAAGDDSLDAILEKHYTRGSAIDLLSIDIDSDDYYIFESLEHFKPRVVIIEHNPTIPPHIDLVQEPREHFGCSALALEKLAQKKGYALAHMSGTNCFFVDEKEFAKLKIERKTVADLFPYDFLSYIVSSMNGSSLLLRDVAYPSSDFFPKHPKYRSETPLIPVFLLRKKTLYTFLRIAKWRVMRHFRA